MNNSSALFSSCLKSEEHKVTVDLITMFRHVYPLFSMYEVMSGNVPTLVVSAYPRLS